MIVSCDQCGTSFNIDDQLIKKGRTKLRCASCKHVFQVIPPSKPIDSPIKEPRSPDAGGNGGGNAEDDTKINFSEEVFDRFGKMEARYLDLGSIGEGGMGEVKLAKDTQLLRKVAVKVLKKEAAASPAALSYFLREAQITAQLDHPNIVPLYTVKEPDTDEKNVSFVMKLIKGQTLTDIITRSRQVFKEDPKAELPPELDLNARLGYFLKACDGVIYAHSKEVIHRDLKPSNVMVGDYGEVYVMDWGIAKRVKEMPETLFGIQKVAARKSELYVGGTELGSVVGTPGYISPEQVKGLPDVGQASD
ncbi:MAG: protein kinase domain-containing protein, partial [Thermodesulfobacteriota bacterium]